MLTLNGKRLARDDAEFAANDCAGYYEPRKSELYILNPAKERVGVINRYGVMGAATKQPDGKYWYSYADVSVIGRYKSHMQSVDETRGAIKTHCPGAYRPDHRPARF